jgi:AcrR family transcriptional regulator
VNAAVEALREVGFAHASAREIAKRAGCNQALVFYHFRSVTELHLAALDQVSIERRERYLPPSAGDSPDLRDLLGTARGILAEDLEQGYVAVLATMIAAAQSDPELGRAVGERIKPWRHFTAERVRAALGQVPFGRRLPADDIAHAVVALYLGLELLASLDGDRTPAVRLFDLADRFAARMTRSRRRSKRSPS